MEADGRSRPGPVPQSIEELQAGRSGMFKHNFHILLLTHFSHHIPLRPNSHLRLSLHPVQSPQAKDAHAGVVRNYTAPTPPQAPALPTDLAGELSKFDAEEPTIGASAAKSTPASTTEDAGEGAQEFLAFLEKDHPKEEAHH